MNYVQRLTGVAIAPEGRAPDSEGETKISVVYEGGAFIAINQDDQEVRIDPEEWPLVRNAIEQMLKECGP